MGIFVKELWASGPTDYEDFDEALLKVRQSDSLSDYQKEFQRLGNRVQGWSKALGVNVQGRFQGKDNGWHPDVQTETLKEAISLARMRDNQVSQQQKSIQPLNLLTADSPSPMELKVASRIKHSPRLNAEEQGARTLL